MITQQRVSWKLPLPGAKVIAIVEKETTSTSTGNGDEGYKGLDPSEIKKNRRETLAIHGVDNLSDTELLEVLVSPGYNGKKAAVCFLNFHTDYQYFTAVIFACDFSGFPNSPDTYYLGKTVHIIGIITEYNSSPEIIIKTPDQIRILK